MKKIFIFIASLVGILIFVVIVLGEFFMKKEFSEVKSICIKDSCFVVELANTPETKKQGLMNREFLPKNKGMLFIFDKPGIYKFWMKNTLIPLDIIWLDKNKEIIFIEHNALPCKEENCVNYGSEKEAKYVLEINGGLSEELNLNINDRAVFK